jgi:hypothetical protein
MYLSSFLPYPLPSLTHLERLNIHYLHQQHVAWLCPVNVKRTSEIVDLGQIDIEDIISTVIVANLTTSPVKRDELGQSWSRFQIEIWIHVSIECMNEVTLSATKMEEGRAEQ